MFGIKGCIDASLQVTQFNDDKSTEQYIMPLEIKTGKASNGVAHRAQTMLYTLLLSDRYNMPIHAGLLYYLKSGQTDMIMARRQELCGLIQGRNEMAQYIVDRERLPSVIQDSYKCSRCFASGVCMMYHKVS
jgi:DNA replication ATP-dependent helicase Dna2